jgi:alkylation response protein AidB-like acyl-CoA dehydrogenase
MTAREWLSAQSDAPADWGAILPPRLDAEGRAWQRRLFEAGFAGVDWPTECGGRGLTAEHRAVWLEEAARAGVPAVLNMVGLVLAANAMIAFGS